MWKRIITGIVLGPTFIWALFALPVAGVQGLIGLVLSAAAWEASALVGFGQTISRLVYTAIIIGVGVASWVAVSSDSVKDIWIIALMALTGFWWLVHVFLLSRFSMGRPGIYGSKFGRMANPFFILVTCWTALNAIYVQDSQHPILLVYMMVLIWVADSGAYFSGKFLGSHKLAVHVSPGKTIEGLVGAVAAASLFSIIYSYTLLNLSGTRLAGWVLLAVIVTLISIAGDLNESALKRVAGKKDSGSIIPGHGGLFDRIDAITAAAPVFYLGWQILDWGLY